MDDRPQRESLRNQGYDYAQPGAYFVTVCVQHRRCLLGEIAGATMQPSIAGLMVES
jgi:putative transposase